MKIYFLNKLSEELRPSQLNDEGILQLTTSSLKLLKETTLDHTPPLFLKHELYKHHRAGTGARNFKVNYVSAQFLVNSELSQIHVIEVGSISQTQVIAEKTPWTETAWKMY